MLDLLHKLHQHATARDDYLAFKEVAGLRSISYRALSTAVAATARRIDEAAPEAAVVIVCLPNTIECPVAFLAALQSNRPAFLINPAVSDEELSRAAEASCAAAVFADEHRSQCAADLGLHRMQVELAEHGQFRPATDSTHAALLLLSSGTTHEPKIVYRDGASLDAVARNCAEAIHVTEADRVLLTIPLCHSYGVEHGILMPIHAGAAVHLCRGIEPNLILPQLSGGEITLIPGVPSMYEMLAGLTEPPSCRSIRCAYSAGAPLPPSIFDTCLDRLGLRIGQLYGSSEVGSITFNDPARPDHDPLSVGQPMAGVEVGIVDPGTRDLADPLPRGAEGEVAIRAPSMLRRYIGQAPAPLQSGFFFTEDLGTLSDAGDLTITGRIKLLIDVGAMKVNPFEVEHVLKEHPLVADCLVLGLPISQTVQRLKALIVLANTANPADAAELRAYTRRRLSSAKVPRVIEIVDSLPRSPTGKLLRRVPAA